MLSLRVPPELKQRLAAVAAESGVTIQSIGRQALEIELAVREEMLVGKAEREELIRRRVRSGEAH
jgi:predicted DNA-binding protein